MTLPALPRSLGGPRSSGAAAAPLTGSIVALAPAGSKYLRVRLDGDPVARTLARLVDGAALAPVVGARVRLELVGRDLTIVRGA